MQLDGFVLCNAAFRDEQQRYCVMGIFDTILASDFPCKHKSLTAYIRLAGVPTKRDIPFEFMITDKTNRSLHKIRGTFTSEGIIAELALPVVDLVLPREGTYKANLSVDNAELSSIEFQAKKQSTN